MIYIMLSYFNYIFGASPQNHLSDTKFRRELDKHPEAFTVDPQPLPESTITVKHSNAQNMFKRSYIEAASLGIGSIGILAMVIRYSRK
jgi:hypothetical protein